MLAAACLAGALVVVVREVRPPPPRTVAVVVAARTVPAGSVLATADVVVAEVPERARQPGALVAVGEAVGRRLGSGLLPGEALTASRLVPRGPMDGLPRGRVALHVLVADPAAVALLAPGLVVTAYPAVGGEPLARSVEVLSVDPPPDVPTGPMDVGTPAGRGVVLALPPEAAGAVLSGHGGLDGPPVVNLAVLDG